MAAEKCIFQPFHFDLGKSFKSDEKETKEREIHFVVVPTLDLCCCLKLVCRHVPVVKCKMIE